MMYVHRASLLRLREELEGFIAGSGGEAQAR